MPSLTASFTGIRLTDARSNAPAGQAASGRRSFPNSPERRCESRISRMNDLPAMDNNKARVIIGSQSMATTS